MNDTLTGIFKRGSITFYNSSRLFRPEIRKEVTELYAFVRLADDFVDSVPQNRSGFEAFRGQYDRAIDGQPVDQPVIRSFVDLAHRRNFQRTWIECFLDTMEQDLWKRQYETLEETLQYTHGSAEVVGLMMARVLDLPHRADPYARLLGRAFQYVNFIRDIHEDSLLGRTYLPHDEIRNAGLPDLSPEAARQEPVAFQAFMRSQIARYRSWRQYGSQGFRYIPSHACVPIRTAAATFDQTARIIERDPTVVFRRKVKPTRAGVLLLAGKTLLSTYAQGRSDQEFLTDASVDEANAPT